MKINILSVHEMTKTKKKHISCIIFIVCVIKLLFSARLSTHDCTGSSFTVPKGAVWCCASVRSTPQWLVRALSQVS